jgi:hypothetical protein
MNATTVERAFTAAVWVFVAWVAASHVLNDPFRGLAAVAFVAAIDRARRECDYRAPDTTARKEG